MQLAWQFTFCQHAAKIFPESSGVTAEKNSNAFAPASCSFGADCCSDLAIIVPCPWLIQASDEMPSDILKMEVRKSISKYSYRAFGLQPAPITIDRRKTEHAWRQTTHSKNQQRHQNQFKDSCSHIILCGQGFFGR